MKEERVKEIACFPVVTMSSSLEVIKNRMETVCVATQIYPATRDYYPWPLSLETDTIW